MRFKVQATRIVHQTTQFEIEADDKLEAFSKADDEICEHEERYKWIDGSTANHDVWNVSRV